MRQKPAATGVNVSLPTDGHVHTEWSWDARAGSMDDSCRRAVAIGLPAVAFTEHVDHTMWTLEPKGLDEGHWLIAMAQRGGIIVPPAFDVDGYLAAIAACRDRYPQLRILAGLELGEPHRHAEQVARVLAVGDFDRVLGSVHSLPQGDGFAEPPGLFAHRAADDVLREYLAELARMVQASDVFAVVAHVDYPAWYWPEDSAGQFDASRFEAEFRETLRMIAHTGRALEMNTAGPLSEPLLRWWREEGGDAITFGSDAHDPEQIARGFPEAVALAEASGFRPSARPTDFWGHA